LAVPLVDADNASAQHLEQLLVEIAKYGKESVRRAYGDWTSTRLTSWKAELLRAGRDLDLALEGGLQILGVLV